MENWRRNAAFATNSVEQFNFRKFDNSDEAANNSDDAGDSCAFEHDCDCEPFIFDSDAHHSA